MVARERIERTADALVGAEDIGKAGALFVFYGGLIDDVFELFALLGDELLLLVDRQRQIIADRIGIIVLAVALVEASLA